MATPTGKPIAASSVISDDHPMLETSGVVSDKFKVISSGLVGVLENTKVSVGRLYLRQIFAGPGANQSDVIEPSAATGLGKTGVSNWAVYDGTGSQANLIANGQGMYTYAGNWNNWFTLVFKNERFKGSTLQVMGASAPDEEENEWAIVGGTGEFTMARGTIQRRVYSFIGGTITQELTMEFFCHMKKVVVPSPTKRGPWGGNGGSLHEMEGKSQRLVSVTINSSGCINYLTFSYIDVNGQIRTSGIWGRIVENATTMETINFGPLESVKQITGLARSNGYVQQFQIITNQKTYGPFGSSTDDSTRFSYTVPEDETVVGFFANLDTATDNHVVAIGVYTI